MLQRPGWGGCDHQDHRFCPCNPGTQRQAANEANFGETWPHCRRNWATVTDLISDSGYFSEANVKACESQGITPYIAVDREHHNQDPWDRFREPPALPEDADAVSRMRHRLKTAAGKATYALRKVTSEPVFGIIKAVMGFRSFRMRGNEAAEGEWNLVCMAWNIKRLHALTR